MHAMLTAYTKGFGTMLDGLPIELYTLRTSQLEVTVITLGGRVIDLKMLSSRGPGTSVILRHDSLAAYITDRSYMGALIGRYANRIAGGQFNCGGTNVRVSRNDGDNSLHGGARGFDQRIWSAQLGTDCLTLGYASPDGEEGFPGDLRVTSRYRLVDNELQLVHEATTTSDTPVNLTSHLYFNLCGDPRAQVLDHMVRLHADQFTPVDATLIPTGEIRDVAGTPFDFRESHAIGERIDQDDPQLLFGQGYDHNWVLRQQGRRLRMAAEVTDPASGRRLEVLTTEPGLQFYSGNQLHGRTHGRRSALCLETQHFPDSPNHPGFPSTILKAGETYRSETTYRFLDSD